MQLEGTGSSYCGDSEPGRRLGWLEVDPTTRSQPTAGNSNGSVGKTSFLTFISFLPSPFASKDFR